jgi:hypothetical protein
VAVILCFACKTEPAGNAAAGPYSAYCARCQPRPVPLTRNGCRRCRERFASLAVFDRHFRGGHRHPSLSPWFRLRPDGVWAGPPMPEAVRAMMRLRDGGQAPGGDSAPSPG